MGLTFELLTLTFDFQSLAKAKRTSRQLSYYYSFEKPSFGTINLKFEGIQMLKEKILKQKFLNKLELFYSSLNMSARFDLGHWRRIVVLHALRPCCYSNRLYAICGRELNVAKI